MSPFHNPASGAKGKVRRLVLMKLPGTTSSASKCVKFDPMTKVFRGHYDGTALIPEQPVDLPIGQSMEVHVQNIPVAPLGNATAVALLAAVQSGPRVTPEDTTELERAIAELPTLESAGGTVFDEPAGT
jgi:hypothetical protein